MKRFFIFTLIIGLMLCMTTLVSPAGAQVNNYQSFVLSNEGGDLISKLMAAGYGNYSAYDILVGLDANSDPSISGVLTDAFLFLFFGLPGNSEVFTTKLSDLSGQSVAVNGDGTLDVVNIFGSTYLDQPGTGTLVTNFSGVGTYNITYSTTGSPLASRTGGTTHAVTYNAFAVAWMPASVPEPGTLLLLGTGLIGLVGFRRRFKK